jgi:Lecithin retinol acyltransferase
MALTQLCFWHYGLQRCDVRNADQLRRLKPGDILSRRAMFEVHPLIRQSVGMLHFGCVVSSPDPESSAAETNTDTLMRSIGVVHYVKNRKGKVCEIRETDMLYFVFGTSVPQRIRNRHEADNVFCIQNDRDQITRNAIVRKARSTKGLKDYSLLSMNCEHWVQGILYNKDMKDTHSIQIQAVLWTAVLVLAICLLIFMRTNRSQKPRARAVT